VGVGVLGTLAGYSLVDITGTYHSPREPLGWAVGILVGLSLAVGAPAVLRWRGVRAAQVAAEQVAREYRTGLPLLGGASVLRDGLAVQGLIRFLDKGGAGPAVPPDGLWPRPGQGDIQGQPGGNR
jgi:hypothetical protein